MFRTKDYRPPEIGISKLSPKSPETAIEFLTQA